MNLYARIKNIYPDITDTAFALQDNSDGQGAFIAQWTYEQPEPTQEQIDAASDTCVALINAQADANRRSAYIVESDPLMAKYLRGECEKQVWLDKVAEIRARYPKMEE